jgi:hypothetical protein
VPALNGASCNGCDDFLGSARKRLFGFVNGQTGVNNPQGFQHLAKDGMVGENAVQTTTASSTLQPIQTRCPPRWPPPRP